MLSAVIWVALRAPAYEPFPTSDNWLELKFYCEFAIASLILLLLLF